MTELAGEVVLKIRTDDSDVSKNTKAAGKKGGESYASGFTSGLKGLAGAAGAALGAKEVIDFLKGGIQAATSFQDEVGALGVIIGKEGTAKIQEFGETSAETFGISKVAALEAAHTFSTFGKSAGLAGNDLADFATDFTGLAGDLASFNGGSTEDAITAIGSALRGEAEPIRRYGVLLDDATLKQAALRLGIIKNIKQALTPQQKVLAAQAEIFRQTKDAQGDSARTADSAANSQKRLTAQLADLRLEIGTKLLPITTDIVQELSDFVSGMQDGTGAGGDFADILKDLADIAETVFKFFDGLPGGVKKYGAELLIASLVISKVSSGLDGLIGKLQTTRVTQDGVARSSFALGGALRTVAGAGGMLAFQDGLKRSNETLGTFETTLGGFAAGFAVGGPIGGGIGAGIGLFLGLRDAIGATEGAELPTPKELGLTDIIGALDEANGLVTDPAGIVAFINGKTKGKPPPGVAVGTTIRDTAKLYGIPDRTVVQALAGSTTAFLRIKATLDAAVKKGGPDSFAVTDRNVLLDSIKTFRAGEQQKRAELLKTIASTKDYGKALASLPKEKRVVVEAEGIVPTISGIAKVAAQIHATPKEVRTLVTATGVKLSERGIQQVIDKAKEYGRTRPTAHLFADTAAASAKIERLIEQLRRLNLTGKVTVNTNATVAEGRSQSGQSDWRGGFSVVGETGPELAWFPKHTAIMSNPRTDQFLQRASSAGPSASELGNAIALALVRSGAVGPVINNPVPETASTSMARQVANTSFLLGV